MTKALSWLYIWPQNIIVSPNYISTIYDDENHPYTTYPFQLCKHLFDRFNMTKGQRLIDVGCGRGEFLHNFQDLGLVVNGVDREQCHSNFLKNIDVKYIDIEKDSIPYDNGTFDIVFSKSVIEHMHDPTNFLYEIHRILKTGGIAIIMTPDWKSNMKVYFDDYTHRTPFTVTSMHDALKMFGFRNIGSELFYQLPILWRFPSLKLLSQFINLFLPVTLKSNIKFIRWSCELMILGHGEK